jgi:hypothetical protein
MSRIRILNDCSQLTRLYCTLFENDRAKTAFFLEEIQFASMNSICQGSAFRLKGFWMNPVLTTLTTPRNSFIYDVLNEVLEKLVPAGIPQYLDRFHIESLFKNYNPFIDSSPKVLKVADLSFGFVLWLTACGVSTCGFLAEKLMFRTRKHLRTLIGLWMVWTILKRRLKKIVL